ncbi:MAG: hypothetical protein MSA15_21305 [Clostridium sp.]|nr:hypothetical protein [Clostridium sp.]
MKATKNDRELKLSAKTTAKKYFSDLREEMLFGDELIDFIRASVLWEKDEGFWVDRYYQYIADEIMNMYFRIYQTCSCCYKQFYKKDMRYVDNVGYCVDCYNDNFEDRKKEVKTKENNNITKFNDLFGDKYEVLSRKDARKITQNMYLKIRCKKCEAVFLKKLANVFRLDKDERELCECSKKTGKKNILADSEKGKELLLIEKRENEKKRKRAQRKKKKDKEKAQRLLEERAKREL